MSLQYGVATPLAITAANLAAASARASAAVTTSTDKNVTAIMVEVAALTTASAPAGNKQLVIYGYMSTDGVTYGGLSAVADDVNGADKSLTAIGSPTNLIYLGTIQLNQGANVVTARGEFEVTGPFGCIPPKWGIVIFNDAGVSLGAQVSAQYREISYN